ncbi:MAG: TIGR03936 family radical SAM-associated protein [Bdellovibrionota bacterium]
MQRLRIKFGRGEEIKFISHLDIMRLWDRAFHRARIPLAYSEGFNPHPKMSLAVPLAVGVTSEAELMDVFVARPVTPHWFTTALNQQLPTGITILGVFQTALTLPSLQSQVRYADYRVRLETTEDGAKDIEASVTALLAAERLPWQHRRDTGQRSYDLRALIDELRVVSVTGSVCTLEMKLRCDSGGAGRPEQVVLALNLPNGLALGFTQHPQSIHRTKLTLDV